MILHGPETILSNFSTVLSEQSETLYRIKRRNRQSRQLLKQQLLTAAQPSCLCCLFLMPEKIAAEGDRTATGRLVAFPSNNSHGPGGTASLGLLAPTSHPSSLSSPSPSLFVKEVAWPCSSSAFWEEALTTAEKS